jgi:type I restriction enzyme S subunit
MNNGSDLPEGWTRVALPSICEINPAKPQANAIPPDAPVTFVPMPAVDADRGIIANPTNRAFSKVRKGFTAFRDGDVIMAKITPCMENGKAALSSGLLNGLAFGSTEFHVLRAGEAVLPEYIYHFIRQQSFRRAAKAQMTGSVGQKRVPASFFEQADLPLPPVDEQKRIVAKVEELVARVNVARARLSRVPTILKRFRQSVLAAACSGRLTADWREEQPTIQAASVRVTQLAAKRRALWEHCEQSRLASAETGTQRFSKYKPPFEPANSPDLELPESWCWATVSHLALQDVGLAFKSAEFAGKGIRLLRGENVEPGSLRWAETRYWPKEKLAGLEYLLIGEGEIILAMDRPVISTGLKIARAKASDLPCLLVQRVMRFKTVEPETAGFLYLCLQHPGFIGFLTHDGMTGSDLPHITGTGVAEYPIALPPLDEQREIVRRVDAIFALADAIEKRVAAAAVRTENLTQAILAKAFRGELVPTEAELARREGRDYEPALVLLERIRVECAASDTGTKPTKRQRTTRRGRSR